MYAAIIALIVTGLVAGIIVAYLRSIIAELREQNTSLQNTLNSRAKSSAAQRSTIKGQLAEQMFPISDRCRYLPSDMQFIGKAFDYLIIDGYTDCKDDGGDIREVIFAEIKTGSSQLSSHQRKIRDAINSGRVRWETINL
jgi:predicted Holliday junction resolvase-like endonuclease